MVKRVRNNQLDGLQKGIYGTIWDDFVHEGTVWGGLGDENHTGSPVGSREKISYMTHKRSHMGLGGKHFYMWEPILYL